jgi:hypothetical protein
LFKLINLAQPFPSPERVLGIHDPISVERIEIAILSSMQFDETNTLAR